MKGFKRVKCRVIEMVVMQSLGCEVPVMEWVTMRVVVGGISDGAIGSDGACGGVGICGGEGGGVAG